MADSSWALAHLPWAELGVTDIDRAAEVIACALAGSQLVLGRWWPPRPILRGLARGGITDEATIEAALEQLGVQVRKQGASSRWRLDHVPDLPRPPVERIADCGCDQRPYEWRLATGGPWTCLLCHPPAGGRPVEYRTTAEGRR